MERSAVFRRLIPVVIVGLPHGVFLAFLLLQHQLMFLAHDDYGLAVLHYVTIRTGFEGQDFSLADVLAFLRGEYSRWSGRLAAYFFHIYVQKIGLDFARFVQSLAIASIAFMAFVLSHRREEASRSIQSDACRSLIPILLFLALPTGSLTDGVYWFAASVTHVWGVPFLLAGACVARASKSLPALSVVLFSLAASFSEQMSLAVIVYVSLFVASRGDHGARDVLRAAVRTLPIFVVSAATIFAPGNFSRFAATGGAGVYADLGAAGVFIRNAEDVAGRLFWPSAYNVFVPFMLLGLLNMLLYMLFAAPRDRLPGNANRKHVAAVLVAAAVPFLLLPFAHEKLRFAAALFVPVAFSLLLLRTAASSRAGRVVLCAHAAGLASLAPLLFAPAGVPWRALLPFLLLEFLPIAYAVAVPAPLWTRRLAPAAVCALGISAVANANLIFEGYRSNREIHAVNDAQLRVASFRQRMGLDSDEPVTLFRLKDGRFGTTMPYQRPLIEVWMKKYYRLDPDTEFTWE